MPEPTTSWVKSALGGADRIMTQSANGFVRTDAFADVVSALTRIEARLRRRIERQATWVWHAYHLPSSTDVRRISVQLAALEARMRDMSERLDELDEAPGRRRGGS